MAKKDKAVSTISTQVLPKSIRASISGRNSFVPLSNSYKWVYGEVTASSSTIDLFSSSMTFMGTTTKLTTTDKILWLGLKHTGTIDGTSKTSDGILIALDNNNSLAYNTGDAMFIDSKEMLVSKFPNTTVGDLTIISTAVLSGLPASSTPGNVKVIVAAMIQDVS